MSRPAPKSLNTTGRRVAQRLLTLQLSIAVVFTTLFGLFMGAEAALNSAAGAAVALIPNSIFAAYAFRHSGARSAQRVVTNFLAGEALKMLLSVVLLVVALIVLDGPLLPLFVVFVILHLSHLLAPILLLKTN